MGIYLLQLFFSPTRYKPISHKLLPTTPLFSSFILTQFHGYNGHIALSERQLCELLVVWQSVGTLGDWQEQCTGEQGRLLPRAGYLINQWYYSLSEVKNETVVIDKKLKTKSQHSNISL